MKNQIRILRIDDNLLDQKIVKDVLKKEPNELEVLENDNCLEFELHLDKSDFDLILSNLRVSGIEGLNVQQRVNEKKTEIPVNILTGKGSKEIADEPVKLVAVEHVIKSAKHIQNLSPIIRKAIENRKIQDDHKATQIALLKSEERFRLLFDNNLDGVLLTQPDGAIIKANLAACKIFGRTETELKQVGRNGVLDVTDPRLAEAIQERSRKGKFEGELTGLRKDGTAFPMEVSSALFQDKDGNLQSSMVIRDITERNHAEKLLQDSEKLYRNLFESMLNGFAYCKMIYDNKIPQDFIYLKVNTAFESLTGLSNVVGKKVSEVIPGIRESDPELFDIYSRVALTGKSEKIEIYMKALKMWLIISIYSPQKEYFVSIFDVVTERKLSEKLIQENNSRLDLAMQAANMAWWEMDMATGNVIFENRKVEMLGYSPDTFKHYKDFMALVHPEDYEKTMNAMQGHINGSLDKYEIEYRILTKSGAYKWFYDVGSIVKRDSKGKPQNIAGIVIDISVRKKSEELLVASEIRYRRLFESAKDGILILDAETGAIVDVNPYLVELLGYSTEQFHGKKIWEIGVFSDFIANRDKFLELQQKEYVRYDDLPLKTIDGRKIDVEFVSNVYEVSHHKVIQCNIRDITKRKIIQKEIRDIAKFPSENPGPIIRIAHDGILLYVNEAGMMQLQDWNLQTGQPAITMLQDVVLKTLDKGKLQEVEFEYREKVFLFSVVPFVEDGYANLYGWDITANKLAEKSLRLSEEKFRIIFDNASDGMFLVDLKTRKFFMCNAACANMLGHTQEEFSNLKIADIFLVEDLPFIYKQIGKLSIGEVGISTDIRFKRKNGSAFFTDLSPTLITIDKVKFLLILFKDITERKKAEEQQIIQTTALEATDTSVVITDVEGIIIWVNKAFTMMTGYSKEEVIGKKPSILKSGKHDKSFYKNMWDTIKGGNVWRGEVFNKRKDNSLLTDEMIITPVLGKDGSVQNFIALKHDITERKNIDKSLKESEMKFRLLLENSADAIFIIDSMGKYIYSNKAVTDLLGYSSEEMLYKTITDLAPEDKKEHYFEILTEILSSGKAFKEIELLKKDGHFVSTDLNSVLLPDGTVYGSCRDITERKMAESEIRNLNTTLELKVEVRTKKLSEVNKNLIKAKALAEQANNAKSIFLSNMSHEIRTPMNAVLGYAELLNNLLEDKTQKDYLNSIMSSGKTLLTLINDILDLSKIEAGKLELKYDYVDTHSFFSEFERIFSWKIEEKGLTFILDIDPGVPAGIYVDETRLQQIILNIIGNAVKFTQEGHIKLKVYIENPQVINLSNKKTEEIIDLVIEVEDTGIGISKEFQEHIFKPFSQEQHKNQFGGTGLGLAITRKLLSLMNGAIHLQSKLKKGTTFQIKISNIPCLRDFEKRKDSFQIEPANIVFEKATILIVDDSVHNRKYFVDAIKNTNIEIIEAEDGLKGYNIAKETIPDLIFTDLQMPKLDGFGLLKKIQGNAKLSHIPVIAYSASVMKEQKEHVFNSKFSGLLIKPVQIADLYLELMNYLPYKSIQTIKNDQPPRKDLLKEINDVQSLLHSLETVYTEIWKRFKVRQPMDEVREFGENIESLGKAHNAATIIKYGNELMTAAENFNIESILKLLKKYEGIVKEVKEYQLKN